MNFVVGYADSPLASSVVQAGIEEARVHGARLHVLRFARVGIRNERPQLIASYRERMAEIGSELEREGVDGVSELHMVQQDPGDALLAELHRLEAKLLVIGSRARSSVGKLLLGSTVQHLVLRAECPVLVVRRPHD